MGSDNSEPIERWTAKRRAALVISILKGETTAAEAARTHGLTIGEIDDWRERFQHGARRDAVERHRVAGSFVYTNCK